MTPDAKIQFRRIPLHPTPDGGMIGGHAAFSQQFLDIAVGKAEAKVPRLPDCSSSTACGHSVRWSAIT